MHLSLLAALVATTLLPSPSRPSAGAEMATSPARHGVVFFCPEEPAAAIDELVRLKRDGFRLIEFASWVWTLPTPGSRLERTAGKVLEWCDANGVEFVLLHNIQFGSAGDGGGLDDAVTDPMRTARFLVDWARVLRGHPSVTGVILGNEIGPVAGTPRSTPAWWSAFEQAMAARHGTIEALNAAWGTHFQRFDQLEPPAQGEPGAVDIEAFALAVFDRFYGTLFQKLVLPGLAPGRRRILVGCKMAGDPLLHRACGSLNMICWDDVLSDYPQWRLKALGDISRRTGKPVFNSELHLYHDVFAFTPSPAKSRYRYLLSALNSEWMTASFAWGQWNKPGIAQIHRATPTILADLDRHAPAIIPFSRVRPQLHVLLTSPLANDDAACQQLYTSIACLGLDWEFVCPQDLPAVRSGTLFIPNGTRVSAADATALLAASRRARLVMAAPDCIRDPYGRPLADGLPMRIARAARQQAGPAAIAVPPGRRLAGPYSIGVDVTYVAWSPERGHYSYPMRYPALEARQEQDGTGLLVAVINHATSGDPIAAQLPWAPRSGEVVTEITAGDQVVPATAPLRFAPLAIRLFRYSRGNQPRTPWRPGPRIQR